MTPPGAWPDEHVTLSTYLQDEIERIQRSLSEGLDEATREMVIAHLEARGYIVLQPGVSISQRLVRLRAENEMLRDQIDSLRKGGSIAP